MTKLYFRYGTMNSGKSAHLAMIAHNYEIQGKIIVVFKPSIDTRDSSKEVVSRTGLKRECDFLIEEDTDIYETLNSVLLKSSRKDRTREINCILVDEAQFLSEKHVDQLRSVALTTPVICYGLRTNHKTRLFEGSKRLMEVADKIEEIKTVCWNCDRKSCVTKLMESDGENDEIILGGEDKYRPLCWRCFSTPRF